MGCRQPWQAGEPRYNPFDEVGLLMRQEIDALMEAAGWDALLVVGPGEHNPAMVYLTGGAFLTRADLIKPRGGEATLFHWSMERDNAAKTGLKVKNLNDYRIDELLKQAGGDQLQATVERYRLMFSDLGITSGKVGLFGLMEAGDAFALFSGLQAALPGLELAGDLQGKVLLEAMATKDDSEVRRIRKMGQITAGVVSEAADFLTSHRAKDGMLVTADDQPLTIGEVKRRINLWLAEREAENPEETIFAQGYDAGVPHSVGDPQAVIRLGQPIVFDIFPCERGGGYFYDLTRTWCLGYATEEAWKLYEDVRSVYEQILAELKAGALCKAYQERTCELFEQRGHATLRSDPLTNNGYVHSLGHGVGLHIHERPFFRMSGTDDEALRPGAVFTVEPGLYYPEQGLGVRLENTFWVKPSGEMETLAEYPMDLVLPIK